MNDFDIERREGAIWVKFGDPDRLNPIDEDVLKGFAEVFGDLEEDATARVVVLSGRGKAFSAGGDLDMVLAMQADPAECTRRTSMFHSVFNGIEESRLVTIAAVHGPAFGGGLELALACDFAVASERAKFGDGHMNLDLLAGGGNTVRLPRTVGTRRTKYLALTGTGIDAHTAAIWGLVAAVFSPEEFDDQVWSIAQTIAGRSADAVAAARSLIRRWESTTIYEDLTAERIAAATQLASADAIAGVTAFIARRQK